VLAISALVLCLFRRRQMRPSNSSPEPLLIPYRHGSYPEPRSGSQTPLITPPPSASCSSPPLAPPAKLRDRRYLQPILKQGAPQLSAASSIGDLAFPPSPIIAPTHGRLKSRHERSTTTSSIRFPMATVAPAPSHYPQSSVYSLSSGPGASTDTVESNKASSIHSGSATVTGNSTPPLSPTKLARAHDGALEASDRVTPAGPPPNRALPTPPPNHPNSPTFSVSPVSPRSPTFPARSLARGGSPAVRAQQQQQGNNIVLPPSTSAQELRDLTESYARETRRESWGSWSGVGGGGPGVSPTGRKRGSGSPRGSAEKKEGTITAVALQELNLEKLSGRY
jgi:hypothetical protein